MKFTLVVALISLVWCGGLPETTASGLLDRFHELKAGGDAVEKKLSDFFQTSIDDKPERARLQKEFFKSYDSLIRFKYDWLVSTLMVKGHDPLTNILSAIVRRNRLDMKKMREELENVIVAFSNIQKIKGHYLTQKKYEFAISEAHIKEADKVVSHLREQIEIEIAYYKTEVWKEYYLQDIESAIASAGNERVDVVVVKQMSQKYPFRSWFAYFYKHPSHIPRRACFESKPTAYFTVGDKELFVIPGPMSITAAQSASATKMLSVIKTNDWFLSTRCDRLALKIYDQMGYTCSEGSKPPRHAFTAVLPYDQFYSSVSNQKLLSKKVVYRYSPVIRWCKRYYQVIVFA